MKAASGDGKERWKRTNSPNCPVPRPSYSSLRTTSSFRFYLALLRARPLSSGLGSLFVSALVGSVQCLLGRGHDIDVYEGLVLAE